MGFKGRCLCGAVTYESTAEPLAFVLCHCRDCQYISGGEPAAVIVIPKPAFKLTKGQLKRYAVTADSGARVVREFCPECGTSMFAAAEGEPDLWAIKAGTLDDPSKLKPTAFLWTKSAQPWAHLDQAIPGFEKQPGQPS
jgi:hypothetical protein